MGWAAAAQAGGAAATAGLQFGLASFTASAQRKASTRQRMWLEKMDNTKYQRTMADMEKAGLNPILAYQQGGGSVPNSPPNQVPDFARAISSSVSNAKDVIMSGEQIKKMTEEKKLINSQEGHIQDQRQLTRAQTVLSRNMGLKAEAEAILAISTTNATDVRTKHERLKIPAAQAESDFDSTEGGKYFRMFKRMMESIRGVQPIRSPRRR